MLAGLGGFRAVPLRDTPPGEESAAEDAAGGEQGGAARPGRVAGLLQTIHAGAAPVRERAREGLQRIQDGASAVRQQERGALLQSAAAGLQDVRHRLRDRVRTHGGGLANLIKERAHLDVAALREAGFGLPSFGAKWEQSKKAAQRRLWEMGSPYRAQVMFGLLCATKSAATADPDMFECVKTRVEDAVDIFWNDLTVYVEQLFQDTENQMLGKAAKTVDELAELGQPPLTCGPAWWRARVLYHYVPFDRSIFGQLKDPIFWVLTVVSLVPLYGIRVAFFALILLLILAGHPPDEYQLVNYIVSFKGSQFFSSGIIQGNIAAVRYYMCVLPGGTHTCDTNGPGAQQDVLTGTIDFLGSCVLTWVAFLFLPCSERSAGMREAVDPTPAEGAPNPDGEQDGGEQAQARVVAEAEPPTPGCCGSTYDRSKGGRLRALLGYDLACFILSLAFGWFLFYVDASHMRPGEAYRQVDWPVVLQDGATWQGHTAIFWARVFYALLSYPFAAFLVPGLNSVLTHTTPTGYNMNGLCVPFMMHPLPDDKKK